MCNSKQDPPSSDPCCTCIFFMKIYPMSLVMQCMKWKSWKLWKLLFWRLHWFLRKRFSLNCIRFRIWKHMLYVSLCLFDEKHEKQCFYVIGGPSIFWPTPEMICPCAGFLSMMMMMMMTMMTMTMTMTSLVVKQNGCTIMWIEHTKIIWKVLVCKSKFHHNNHQKSLFICWHSVPSSTDKVEPHSKSLNVKKRNA